MTPDEPPAPRPAPVWGAALDEAPDFAALVMYPFEQLRPAWEALYEAIASDVSRDARGVPNELRWDLAARDTWLDPHLTIGMACGWPLITELDRRVRVVGTFAYSIDGMASHTYRSVIVAREMAAVADMSGATFAFNSTDSLSGWVSMISVLPHGRTSWDGPVLETGSHLASIAAVRSGAAEVASIDAVSWSYIGRDVPELVEGLVVIDRGPEVPHLPLIVRLETTDEALAAWRTACAGAIRDPALVATLDTLLIEGFVALDADDYHRWLDPLRRTGL